jgi:hypothetical protein
MSERIRLTTFATLGVLALALCALALTARPVAAQNPLPRHAVCQDFSKGVDARRLQEWMNARLVDGKSGFIATGPVVCAW